MTSKPAILWWKPLMVASASLHIVGRPGEDDAHDWLVGVSPDLAGPWWEHPNRCTSAPPC
jgi:hypothetical protein